MTIEEPVAVIALIIVIVGHLCTTVWWMSKITTILQRLQEDVKEGTQEIKLGVKKAECEKIHAHIEKQFDDVWKAINK